MNDKYKFSQPFTIILLTVGMLFVLTVLKSGFSIGSFTFKPVNILSDVVKKPKPLALISTLPKEKIVFTKKELKLFKKVRLNQDSLMLVMEKDERISDFRTDSLDVLGRFFSSLIWLFISSRCLMEQNSYTPERSSRKLHALPFILSMHFSLHIECSSMCAR